MQADNENSGFVELGGQEPSAGANLTGDLDAALLMRPRSGTQIVDLSIEILMGRALACIGICVLLWFPLRIVMPWFLEWMALDPDNLDNASVGMFMGSTVGLMLAQLFVGILSMTAVTVLVYGELVGKPVRATEALAVTVKHSPGLVGLFVASGLLVGAGVGVLFVASFLCPLIFPIALALYFFLTWRLSVAASVLVLERAGVVESIRRSWALTRGNFWRWAVVSALTYVLVMWFSGFLQVGDNLDVRRAVLDSLKIPSALFTPIFVVISAVFSGVATAVASAAMTSYYFDTRMRKEGFDLFMRLERQVSRGRES